MTPIRFICSGLLLLLSLAGCSEKSQYDRPGAWKLPPAGQGANDTNLRAMIANPEDLVQGASAPGTPGAEVVNPVNRLYEGRRRPLPSGTALNSSGGGTIDAAAIGGTNSSGSSGTASGGGQ